MKTVQRRFGMLLMILAAVALIAAGCGNKPTAPEDKPAEESGSDSGTNAGSETNGDSDSDTSAGAEAKYCASPTAELENTAADDPHHKDTNPVVTIEMEDGCKVMLELYPEVAPNTVDNFLSLVNKGFYDGLGFHRIIDQFMIQGGDPEGTGGGGPGYNIAGEFAINKFNNDLQHERGVLSMARQPDPHYDTAGSQFFIMVADSPHLDGSYAAFGKVIAGMETVDGIVAHPSPAPVMKTVTADTGGTTYNEPKTIKK
ncbi:peptidylprolyl isomerase [Paenibacillaceae bacterium]|nr:peptidylprolyl isomerase [Paenibacillaceae bacterium]